MSNRFKKCHPHKFAEKCHPHKLFDGGCNEWKTLMISMHKGQTLDQCVDLCLKTDKCEGMYRNFFQFLDILPNDVEKFYSDINYIPIFKLVMLKTEKFSFPACFFTI